MNKIIRTTDHRIRTLVDRFNRSLEDERVGVNIEYKADGNWVGARVWWSPNYRGDNEEALEMFLNSMEEARIFADYINYSDFTVIKPDGPINDDMFHEFFEEEYEQAVATGWYYPSIDYLMDVDYIPVIENKTIHGKQIRRIEEYVNKMESAS